MEWSAPSGVCLQNVCLVRIILAAKLLINDAIRSEKMRKTILAKYVQTKECIRKMTLTSIK